MASTKKAPLRPLGIRVPQDVWEILDIVRVVEGHRSMQELLRPVIEAYVGKYADVPEVQEIRRQVAQYRRGRGKKPPLMPVPDETHASP